MIKKPFISLVLLAISVSACSSAQSQSNPQNSRTLNPMSELAVGTLKLDGTKNAVTKEQAAQLIPMWQVYKQLVASSTSAPAEIDGLSAQIRDTMTSEQRKAITDMKLAQSDVFAFMQPQGGSAPSGTTGQSSRSSNNSQGGGFPGAGGPPPDMGGGMPGGGMPGDGATSRQATGTQTANSAQGGTQSARPANANRVPSPLVDALLQYLQKVEAS